MQIRFATTDDLSTLVQLRMDFLSDGGAVWTGEERANKVGELQAFFASALPTGELCAVLAEENGVACSAAYMTVTRRYARRVERICPCGMIYNVYTYPSYRRRGLATKLMETLIQYAEELGLETVDLLASEEGRPLYEKLGFREPSHTYMAKRMK